MVGKVSSARLMAAVHGSLDQGGGGRVQFLGFVGLKSLFLEDHQPQVLEKTLESPLD